MNHWDLLCLKDGKKVSSRQVFETQVGDMLIRIQGNASISIALKSLNNVRGLVIGKTNDLTSLEDVALEKKELVVSSRKETKTGDSLYSRLVEPL